MVLPTTSDRSVSSDRCMSATTDQAAAVSDVFVRVLTSVSPSATFASLVSVKSPG